MVVVLGIDADHGAERGQRQHAVYDSYARPASSTAATGAVTTYTYAASTPWSSTATVNGRWTRKTLDGFGRTVLTETGNGSTTVSQTDTVYASCACSPTGKVKQQSLPHAPGAQVNWIVYNYDGLGRSSNFSDAINPNDTAETVVEPNASPPGCSRRTRFSSRR